MHRVAVRVAGEREDVRKRTFSAAHLLPMMATMSELSGSSLSNQVSAVSASAFFRM